MLPLIGAGNGGQKIVVGGNSLLTDLVSFWKGDESSGDLIDAHGSYDFTETGATIGTRTGLVYSGARDIKNKDSPLQYFARSIAGTGLDHGDIDLTYMFWLKHDTISSNYHCFIYESTAIKIDAGAPTSSPIFIRTSNGTYSVTNTTFGNPGVGSSDWVMTLLQYDSTNDLIRINTNDTGWDEASAAYIPSGGNLCFGAFAVYWFSFDGAFGPVARWNRLITDEEVTDLYNSGAGRPYDYFQ